MNPNEYQVKAYTFVQAPTDKEIGYFSMAISGEVGELVNVRKKEIRNDKSYKKKIIDESGDIVWYLCALGTEYGFTFEEVIKTSNEAMKYISGSLRTCFRDLGRAALYLDEYLEHNPFSEGRFLIYYISTVYRYLSVIWKFYNISLEEVMETNIEKLSERSETDTIKEHK